MRERMGKEEGAEWPERVLKAAHHDGTERFGTEREKWSKMEVRSLRQMLKSLRQILKKSYKAVGLLGPVHLHLHHTSYMLRSLRYLPRYPGIMPVFMPVFCCVCTCSSEPIPTCAYIPST
jgi:hypothetical protein